MQDVLRPLVGKKGVAQVQSILTIILVIAVCIVLFKIYKAAKSGSKLIGEQVGDNIISLQSGIPAARIQWIRAKAYDLWDKGCTGWFLTFNYDEDMFISVINSMTSTKELSYLNDFFKQNHSKGLDLKGVITDSFSSNDKARLTNGYTAFLNSI